MPSVPRKRLIATTADDGKPIEPVDFNPLQPLIGGGIQLWQSKRMKIFKICCVIVAVFHACFRLYLKSGNSTWIYQEQYLYWSSLVLKWILILGIMTIVLGFAAGSWLLGNRIPAYYVAGVCVLFILPLQTSSYIEPVVEQLTGSKWFYMIASSGLIAFHGLLWFIYGIYAHLYHGGGYGQTIFWLGIFGAMFSYPLIETLEIRSAIIAYDKLDECLRLAQGVTIAIDECYIRYWADSL